MSVLLGYGNGSFADQITYSTGIAPWFVTVDDLNNDTHPDIIVTNQESNDVSVLLGHGDGSFPNQTTYPTGAKPLYVAITDANNDTRLDLVVANSYNNDLSVLLEYGDGTFANQVMYAAGSVPFFVAVADLNNDGIPDFVVANKHSDDATILFGCPYETYAIQATLTPANGSQPHLIVIGDFNNDGILDIIIAIHDSNNVGVLRGEGTGTFKDMILISMEYGSHPFSVVVGDFNNDRKLDFAVANDDSDNVYVF